MEDAQKGKKSEKQTNKQTRHCIEVSNHELARKLHCQIPLRI